MEFESDAGPLPELAWLPVSHLIIDPSYQRTLESRRSQKLIRNLVKEFKWAAFQAILAVKAGTGTWVVIDGQHRVEAARRRGFAHVPAVVVEAASVEEQALAFIKTNLDRVAINQFQLHHARIAAKDPLAAKIGRLCTEANLSIPRYPLPATKLKPGQTLAIGTLGHLVQNFTMATAVIIARSVADAYRDDPGMLRAQIFRSAAVVIIHHETETDRKLCARNLTAFLKRSGSELISKTFNLRMAEGLTEVAAMARIMREGIKQGPLPAKIVRIEPAAALKMDPAPAVGVSISTPAMLSRDQRLIRLLRQGSPKSRIAEMLGVSLEEVNEAERLARVG